MRSAGDKMKEALVLTIAAAAAVAGALQLIA
jgi:hypothetical protein